MADSETNRYAPPRAELFHPDTVVRLYSPMQVFSAAWIGGPLRMMWTLRSNFLALDQPARAGQTLIWGIVFTIALLAVMPFVPDGFPSFVIPIGYSFAGRYLAEKLQKTKQDIESSGNLSFHSNWKVLGIALICLAILLLLLVANPLAIAARQS